MKEEERKEKKGCASHASHMPLNEGGWALGFEEKGKQTGPWEENKKKVTSAGGRNMTNSAQHV